MEPLHEPRMQSRQAPACRRITGLSADVIVDSSLGMARCSTNGAGCSLAAVLGSGPTGADAEHRLAFVDRLLATPPVSFDRR